MMETVESTLKVPAPEKMAEGWEEELDDNEEDIAGKFYPLPQWVSPPA